MVRWCSLSDEAIDLIAEGDYSQFIEELLKSGGQGVEIMLGGVCYFGKTVNFINVINNLPKCLSGTKVTHVAIECNDGAFAVDFAYFLENLRLQGTKVYDVVFEGNHLVSCEIDFSKNTNITQFGLGFNDLQDRIIRLATCLKGSNVTAVELQCNGICDEVAIAFAEELKGTNVVSVDLSQNNIGEDALRKVDEAISYNRSLFVKYGAIFSQLQTQKPFSVVQDDNGALIINENLARHSFPMEMCKSFMEYVAPSTLQPGLHNAMLSAWKKHQSKENKITQETAYNLRLADAHSDETEKNNHFRIF